MKKKQLRNYNRAGIAYARRATRVHCPVNNQVLLYLVRLLRNASKVPLIRKKTLRVTMSGTPYNKTCRECTADIGTQHTPRCDCRQGIQRRYLRTRYAMIWCLVCYRAQLKCTVNTEPCPVNARAGVVTINDVMACRWLVLLKVRTYKCV